MTHEVDSNDTEGDRRREPWQVVGCSTCNVPAGIRCVGSRGVSTHSARKRVFFQRLEEERAEREEARSADLQSKGRRGRGSRKERKGRSNAATAPSPAYSSDFTVGEAERPTPIPTPEWASLAARLRAEHKMSPPSPAPSSVPPWEDDPEPSAEVGTPPPATLPTNQQLPPSSAVVQASRFVFERKVENPDVWKKIACPRCRAPAGTRCFGGLLSEPRFASHPQRTAAYAEMSSSGD